MGTHKSFMDEVLLQLGGAGTVTCRKMFGEYAVYLDGKVVALACDNQLFFKPTEPGRAFMKDPQEAPPYPGAKPHLLVEDRLDDPEWLSQLARLTAAALPAPKPKKRGKPRP